MGNNNYVNLDKEFNLKLEEDNQDYKKKYYSLIRDLSRTHTMMCERCPLVKSCCGGCTLLRSKINKLKREQNNDN